MNELRNDLTGFVSAHKDELQLEHERQIANLQLHSEAAAYGVNNVRNFIASLQNEVVSQTIVGRVASILIICRIFHREILYRKLV